MSEENPIAMSICDFDKSYKELTKEKDKLENDLISLSYKIYRNHTLRALNRFRRNYKIHLSWEDARIVCQCRSCIWIREYMKD
jgi:biotin synthase-related radical SAM superfamily protein